MIELSSQPMTWVAAGDSITQACRHTYGARGWVEHLQERVRWQMGRFTDVVVNVGVTGWRAIDVLGAYDQLIGRFTPDVLSISLGTNDSLCGADGLPVFQDAMREIIGKTVGAQIVLHTPALLIPSSRDDYPSMPAFSQAVRELAAETGALLVDHEKDWLAHFTDADPTAWLDDHVHPNAVGHRRMADLTVRTTGLGELVDF